MSKKFILKAMTIICCCLFYTQSMAMDSKWNISAEGRTEKIAYLTENPWKYSFPSPGDWQNQILNFNEKFAKLQFSDYCIPTSDYYNFVYLQEIKSTGATTDINYALTSPPTGAYLDETAQLFEASNGQTFSVNATINGTYNSTVNIWADWNNDGEFDSGELITSGFGNTMLLFFTVPIDTPDGTYRVRVRGSWGSAHDPNLAPCGNTLYGTTVDFALKVTSDGEGCAIDCPQNINTTAPPDANSAIVEYNVNYVCEPENSNAELVLVSGLASGSEFPIGTTTITYNLVDGEEILDTCSFEVTVNESTSPTYNCKQENPRNGIGVDNSVTSAELVPVKTANDIIVEQGKNFTLNSITTNLLTWSSITKVKVTIYKDSDGFPGSQVYFQENIIPEATYLEVSDTFYVYEVTTDITPFLLEGNEDEDTRYWVQLEFLNSATVIPNSEMIHMETSLDSMVGLQMVMKVDGVWEYLASIPANIPMDGVISFYGECEDLNVSEPENCEITCPEDITVTVASGADTAIVEYEINYECEAGTGQAELILAEGLESGSEFPIGTTTITYNLVYEDEVLDTCSFEVTVEEYTPELYDCEQENPRNGDGVDYSHTTAELVPWKTANDIIVEQGKNFTLNSITTNLLTWSEITKAKVTIYEDADGLPGTQVYVQENITPEATYLEVSGTLYVYKVTTDITPFLLEGSENEDSRYWVQLEFLNSTNSDMIHMETSLDSMVGLPMVELDNGIWNYVYTIPANEPQDGVISFYGECEDFVVIEPVNCEINCPENINITVESGATSAIVEYEIGYECEEGGSQVELQLVAGLESGSQFPLGTTTIIYSLIYEGQLLDTCSFTVTVDEDDTTIPVTCDEQEVLSSGQIEGALGFDDQKIAVDVHTGDTGYTIYGMEPIFVGEATTVKFVFYEDENGLPGTEYQTVTGNIVETTLVTTVGEYEFYKHKVAFGSPVTLQPNSKYWVEVEADAIGWEFTASKTLGSKAAFSNSNTNGEWVEDPDVEMIYDFICEELGINDWNSDNFSYYPNPVKDILNIKSNKNIKSISVFNLAGQRLIAEAKVSNGQINLSALNPGTFVFRVILEDGQVETFKIVKK